MKLFRKKKKASVGGFLKKGFVGDFDVSGGLKSFIPYLKTKIKNGFNSLGASKEKLKDIPGTNYKLGVYHMQKGNFSDAILRFKMVCYLDPNNTDSLYHLSRCLLLKGEEKKAQKKLELLMKKEPKHVEGKYLLQKITSPEKVESVPLSIVKETVDIRANFYMEDYIDAGYIGARVLVNEVLKDVEAKNPNFTVLDLGCGTGECGVILRERGLAKHITGIDLSDIMTELSSSRMVDGQNAYDEVKEIEISEYLKNEKTSKYDLVLAILSFDFFGNLEPIADNIKNLLNKGGYFGLIARDEPELKNGYILNVDYEDFSHSQQYVKDTFQKVGLKLSKTKEIEIVEEEMGILYIFTS